MRFHWFGLDCWRFGFQARASHLAIDLGPGAVTLSRPSRKAVLGAAFVAYNVASIPLAASVLATTPPLHFAYALGAFAVLGAVIRTARAIWRPIQARRRVARRLAYA